MNRFVTCCLLGLALVIPLPVNAQDASADRIRSLEEQLEQQRAMISQQQATLERMQQELDALKADASETRPAPEVAAATPASSEDEPTGVPVVTSAADTGLNPSLEISGFVNLDMIYDFDRVAPIYESTLVPTTIPTVPGLYGSDGNFIASIKQSRMAFRSSMDTPYGPASALIEFDLFGTGSDAGRNAFNLRHAWFELGRFGVGQTWSTFMDISTWPNVYDWWGPSGMVLNRNPMVRYTVPLDDRGSQFAVALEQQNASFNAGIFTELAPGLIEDFLAKSDFPDLVARWRTERDWGHFQAAGVARHLTLERLNTEMRNQDTSEFGYGVNVTGIWNVFGRDQIKYGLTWGRGIASFINDGGGSNLVPELRGSSISVEPLKSLGYMLYYDHYWSDRWSSSIGLSQNNNKLTNLQISNEPDKVTYASTNLFYTHSPFFLTGLEALYGKLENADGSSGTDFRIQLTARLNFAHDFKTR